MAQLSAAVEAAPSAVDLRLWTAPFGPSQYRPRDQGRSQGCSGASGWRVACAAVRSRQQRALRLLILTAFTPVIKYLDSNGNLMFLL